MPLGTLIELGPMAMIELTGLRTPPVAAGDAARVRLPSSLFRALVIAR
jgi:hypothetical protein